MAGHVYLVGSPRFKWYKIGKSSNAAIRVTELGILMPFRIEVIAVWRAENHHALERLLHEKYGKFRINGEWFSFTDKQIKAILSHLAQASTVVATRFSNVEDDVAPEGKVIRIKFKKNLTEAEREESNRIGMAQKEKKAGIRWCVTCRRRIPERLAERLKNSSCA